MSYHLLQKLSRDLNKIFETKAYYDVIIRVGDNTETKEFQAHSLILRARVPYFHQYLQSDQAKQEYDKIVITNHTISPAIFEIILKYVLLFIVYCLFYFIFTRNLYFLFFIFKDIFIQVDSNFLIVLESKHLSYFLQRMILDLKKH